eukprot:gene781-554_t
MSAIMRAPSQKLNMVIENSRKPGMSLGTVEIRAEAQRNTRDMLVIKVSGHKLSNKEGIFGRSDPFLEISRANEDGTYTPVWRSVKIDSTLNPKWPEVKIPLVNLCNSDLNRKLIIEIWDHERNGRHRSMGKVYSSPYDSDRLYGVFGFGARVRLFDTGVGGGKSGVTNAAMANGGNGMNSGANAWMATQTANTGAAVGGSLQSGSYYGNHYHSGHLPTSTSANYTSVQHCFPIYGGTNQVAGVAGILQAYQDGLQHVLLSGPTLLAPIITATAQWAANDGCTQQRQRYYILLLITDGVVNDMEATKLAIIQASKQPLSIIIVGVGPADFKDMDSLDSDRQLLQVNRQVADRDIVQFIPFRSGLATTALAQQVLAEIPDQLLEYMAKRKIVPNAPTSNTA